MLHLLLGLKKIMLTKLQNKQSPDDDKRNLACQLLDNGAKTFYISYREYQAMIEIRKSLVLAEFSSV